MKKALIITLIALSSIMILDTANAGHALFMFFLAGVIPGTNIIISAERMLQLFTLLIGFTLSRITLTALRHLATHQAQPRRRALKAHA